MEPETANSTNQASTGTKNEHDTSSHNIDNQTANDNPGETLSNTDEWEVGVAAAKIVNNQVDKEENIVEFLIEPHTGASFPVKLDDGKELAAVGLRKKSFLGIGIKIYGFGIYAETEKLKELLRSKMNEVYLAAAKPTAEMYQMVIDSDVGMTVRLVLAFPGITMSMVRKNFDEGLGASIKKLNGGEENNELTNMVMGEASNEIKLPAGSVIEITRLPGYILQTKG
ncbi:fatty-acid-binding protein 1-like isoform X3 [Papaver somniferum]|uniref:fatty-acid-binding protein 1-like isoform X3 n=1 Tax=Papaver somniferum TaxID=3469 RepID=UPI000E6F82B6|nr:fatty-acid-binding protein 1-like isoform X3 [Papaver somniferum]